jgi:hypothetical protein
MTPREPLGEARCREILEVAPEAGLDEIRRAHAFLRGLYLPGSGGLVAPSMDEFSPEAQARVLAEIEAAFAELCGLVDAAQPAPPPPRPRAPDRVLDGPGLRRIREESGFTLEAMASETNVRAAYLDALEQERFRDLPSAGVIVRGYLTAYLAALSVDSPGTVAEYVLRYQRWQGKP